MHLPRVYAFMHLTNPPHNTFMPEIAFLKEMPGGVRTLNLKSSLRFADSNCASGMPLK